MRGISKFEPDSDLGMEIEKPFILDTKTPLPIVERQGFHQSERRQMRSMKVKIRHAYTVVPLQLSNPALVVCKPVTRRRDTCTMFQSFSELLLATSGIKLSILGESADDRDLSAAPLFVS